MSWLGNAGFLFDFGQTRLLIDPFLTRPSLAHLLFGRVSPNTAALREHDLTCDAILISHAHFDHCIDAPDIARSNGARLYGSSNTCDIARACGVPDHQTQRIQENEKFCVNELHIQSIPAHHPWLPGYTAGKLPARLKPPLHLRDYRMDECVSFFIQSRPSVLVWSSTSTRGARQADMLICRAVAEASWYRELLGAVRPRLAIPSHWDDMFCPLSKTTRPFFAPPRAAFPPIGHINLEGFRSRVARAYPGCRVLLPQRFYKYTLQDDLP